MNKYLIGKLQSVGRAEQKLEDLLSELDNSTFINTSKHDSFWNSEHEIEADKLDDLRMKFSFLKDTLYEVHSILVGDRDCFS